PVGGPKAFYSGGEIDVAKAAKGGNHLQILSTVTTSSVEDVTVARGAPIWYQLYATNTWAVATAFVTRAEKAGCLAVATTVGRVGGGCRGGGGPQRGSVGPPPAHGRARMFGLPRPKQPTI